MERCRVRGKLLAGLEHELENIGQQFLFYVNIDLRFGTEFMIAAHDLFAEEDVHAGVVVDF